MEFTIQFYRQASGNEPVFEFLKKVENKNPILHAGLAKGIQKIKSSENHKKPLSCPLGEGLFELRISANKMIGRVYYCFSKNKKIVLLHGIIKKKQKIPKKDEKLARKYMSDYKILYNC